MQSGFRRAARFMFVCLAGVACLQSGWARADAPAQIVPIGFPGEIGVSPVMLGVSNSAQLAIDEANKAKPHVGGKPVFFTLLPHDDKSDKNFATIAANYFIRSGVIGVIGHNGTDAALATGPLYAKADIPQIMPIASGREITEKGFRNVFQLLGNNNITVGHLAETALEIVPGRRFAVIDNGLTFGSNVANAFAKRLQERGADIVFTTSVTEKFTGFDSMLENLKEKQVDFILFTGFGWQARAFSRSLQQVNSPAKLLVMGGSVNPEFPSAGVYGEGTLLLQDGRPIESLPGYQAFEKRYRQRFTTPISTYAIFAYDAVGVLVAAIKEADTLDRAAIIDTLHKIDYKGLSGPVSFAADGRSNNPPFTLYQVSQGKWRPIKVFGAGAPSASSKAAAR